MKKYMCLLVFALFAFACNNDDDSSPNNDEFMLNGPWSLINLSGGLAGVDEDFEVGVITWDFDIQAQELTITNANTEPVIDGFPTGVYDLQVLTTTGETVSIVIDNISLDIVTLTNNQLILDEGIVLDGFLYTFTK